MNAKELLGRLEPHVGLASSPAGALGFGSVMALATDAGEMFVEHTGAAELCRLGILRAPALLAETLPNDFAVNPAVVLEVREHREEWLGL